MKPSVLTVGSRLTALILLFVALPARADLPPVTELSGPIVLAGGRDVSDKTLAEFVALAGKENAKIVVIPTAIATAEDPKTVEDVLKPWADLKPASVVALHTRDPKTADDPAFVKPLTEATGVWLTHGHPDRLVNAYRGTLVEKELKKLQARGGVVGGTGAGASVLTDLVVLRTPEEESTAPGLGLLPGFLYDPKRDGRVTKVLPRNPAYVGLSFEDGAAMILRGRFAHVIGDKSVTVHLAKGAGKPALAEVLHKPVPGQTARLDVFQARRAAANRAATQPFPPAKPREPFVEKGTLVICGGGGTTDDIKKKFVEAAGGPDALVVAIPTTESSGPGEVKYLQSFGLKNVKLLHPKSRTQANDPSFSEPLLTAGGVWFGGGRQWNFVDSYEGTLTEKRFHSVLTRGGVIGGSSAGASIQSEYMPRGHPLRNTIVAAEGYERGFAFLPGCAVDQHFFARKRLGDMTGLMKQYPQYLGIGIDEATAIVVTGSTAEVIGRSKVAFYDYHKRVNGDADYEVLTAGDKYDLKKREKMK
jgi:cyanophycinase